MVVNEKVSVLAGFGLTPLAFATAPLATQAKVPMVVMAAATSAITERSPYHRAHLVHPAAGHRADGRLGGQERHQEASSPSSPITGRASTPRPRSPSGSRRRAARSSNPSACRSRNPDFAPFLQRVKDAKPRRRLRVRAVGRRRGRS